MVSSEEPSESIHAGGTAHSLIPPADAAAEWLVDDDFSLFEAAAYTASEQKSRACSTQEHRAWFWRGRRGFGELAAQYIYVVAKSEGPQERTGCAVLLQVDADCIPII